MSEKLINIGKDKTGQNKQKKTQTKQISNQANVYTNTLKRLQLSRIPIT